MKLIILDRDGVINIDSDEFIKSPAEWLPIPGSLEAIAKLNQAGYTVAVATNQSGIARGYFNVEELSLINKKMQELAAKLGGKVDNVFYCPHGPDDHCECRKPKSGLFKQISEHYQLDINDCYAVGDSLRDLQAAAQVGCKPILVKTGKGERTLASDEFEQWRKKSFIRNIPVYNSLADFVDTLTNSSV